MATSAIDRVTANLRQRANEARARYREILGILSSDPDAVVDDLEKVMLNAGKSVEQLRKDLETLAARRKAAATLDGTDPDIQDAVEREQLFRAEKDAADAKIAELRKLISEWDSAEAARVVAEERWRHARSVLSGEKARARRFLIETADRMATEEQKIDPARLQLW